MLTTVTQKERHDGLISTGRMPSPASYCDPSKYCQPFIKGEGVMTGLRMTSAVIIVVLAGLAANTIVEARQSQKKTSGSKVRVGTFDSRALAMAYFATEAFNRQLSGLRAEHEEAKAAEDEKRVKESFAELRALGELMHKQGFSTWPVDNILETIKEKIPVIAKQGNVDVIICKWDIVYHGSEVEFVDVTDLMVQPFNPDKETLKTIKDVQKHDPVPLDEIKNDH